MKLLTSPLVFGMNQEEVRELEERFYRERGDMLGEHTYNMGDIQIKGILLKYSFEWDVNSDIFTVSLYFARLWG